VIAALQNSNTHIVESESIVHPDKTTG